MMHKKYNVLLTTATTGLLLLCPMYLANAKSQGHNAVQPAVSLQQNQRSKSVLQRQAQPRLQINAKAPKAYVGQSSSTSTESYKPVSYDISTWQGYVNDNQARQLKNEVNFMILKAENGGIYEDSQFKHNAAEMAANHIPYGAYDFSTYANPAQASEEAQALYQRAPNARFYVNDSEQNYAGTQANLDGSTQAWSNELHRLTAKPIVLYSDLSFMNQMSQQTRNSYDALWVAAYGAEPDPAWHYDLWQYTDQHYSPALGQNVDASTVPYGGKSIRYWIGSGSSRRIPRYNKPVRKRHIRRRIVKPKHRSIPKKYRRKRIRINSNYYQSHNIKHLRVLGSYGINLYTPDYYLVKHMPYGSIIPVDHFKTVYHISTGYMTKAVTYYHGKPVIFTSNKKLMRPYYYHWHRRYYLRRR